MYFNPFDYQTAQLCLEERLREAQACHASHRRMIQQLGQAMSWLGNQFILWRRYLQTQPQTLDLRSN